MNDLKQRKHPVHMAPIERHNCPVVLFVTIAVKPRRDVLANRNFHTAFKIALMDADAWRTVAYVLMPDHIHMFVVPNHYPMLGVKPWSEYLKRQVTIHLGAHPEWNWMPGCWDTQIRNREGYLEKRSYVTMNPVRAGLVTEPEAWPWRGEGEGVRW